MSDSACDNIWSLVSNASTIYVIIEGVKNVVSVARKAFKIYRDGLLIPYIGPATEVEEQIKKIKKELDSFSPETKRKLLKLGVPSMHTLQYLEEKWYG